MSGSSITTAVIKPRSKFDRELARIEQQCVWEFAAQTVRDDASAIARSEELALEAYRLGFPDNPEATKPTDTQRLRALTVCREFMALAHTIRKETFQDRTFPSLARIEYSEAIDLLPASDAVEMPAESESERMIAETHSMVRRLLAELAAGRGSHPGLVLIEGGRRAG